MKERLDIKRDCEFMRKKSNKKKDMYGIDPWLKEKGTDDLRDEDDLELSEETIRQIEEARKRMKKGKYYTEEEVKKKLKIK